MFPQPPAFLLSLLLALALTGCERSVPGAAAVFEFVSSQPVPEDKLRELLPQDDPAVSLRRLPGTNLYEVTVRNPDASEAVRRTDQVLDALRGRLHNETAGAQFRIWQGARAAEVPAG